MTSADPFVRNMLKHGHKLYGTRIKADAKVDILLQTL